ncbi:hypothetical protein Tco_0352796 [Tanacetum coccineum]
MQKQQQQSTVAGFKTLNRCSHGFLRQNATRFLMDVVYINSGPLQFEGPVADSKAISLCVEDLDYMGRIKELNDYLDKFMNYIFVSGEIICGVMVGLLLPQMENAVLSLTSFMIYCIIRVGDGPRDKMKEFDNNVPQCQFDNFQVGVQASRKIDELTMMKLLKGEANGMAGGCWASLNLPTVILTSEPSRVRTLRESVRCKRKTFSSKVGIGSMVCYSYFNIQFFFVMKDVLRSDYIEGIPLKSMAAKTPFHVENIYESFKVIIQGKTFWIRAKEVSGWMPDFEEDIDQDSKSDDELSNEGSFDENGGLRITPNVEGDSDLEDVVELQQTT